MNVSVASRTIAFALTAGCGSTPGLDPPVAGANGGVLEVCSGCAAEVRDPNDAQIRVHHVHLNVTDVAATIAFYERFFGAKAVRLNGVADALWADPLLLLLEPGEHAEPETLQVGFEHVGLGVDDVAAWFEQASQQGLLADTRNGSSATPFSFPLPPGSSPFVDPEVDNFSFIYVRGPNAERIEVWSGRLRFRHAHFVTPDVDATAAWYARLLGVAPVLPMAAVGLLTTNAIALGEVTLDFVAPLAPVEFVEMDRQPIGHVALSVANLDAMFARAQQHGAEIVSEPAMTALGFRSFFVRAPQAVLLEFVEAGPVGVR